ncbi:uncharacterized protein TRIADDRAFT_51656 [Trichoplax adhaerens]|uniref:Uncharacterized protein n=1 Tax=Trichoplax adhaerens TaxID=10228 RepID=B3RKE9_TRIAD|nr:hypothetical protein TRIADDRAFT_51656 [Trichoplax adhaerens]EDV29394.1 hypothetical protein TRIADDRAFT_51656 [Trichoplax adhaerens]|eukprot:XP_002108596.1 hypothetical protein TRIADDRAFT_51656 [Trichoplax adhaerens]
MIDSNQPTLTTSTRIGYNPGPDGPFPSSNFKAPRNSIPLGIREGKYNLTKQMYTTTNNDTLYNHENPSQFKNSRYTKPQPFYQVQYTGNVIEKIDSLPRGRELTTGNQNTEMKSNYNGERDVQINLSANRPHILNEHHSRFQNQFNDGKLKPIYIKESVRKSNVEKYFDPYATQSQLSFEHHTQEKIAPYAKNDIATYWACENFPKVRGFGPKQNVLPKLPTPTGPLTNRNPYFSKIKEIRTPKSANFVPNSGLKPTYSTYENHDLKQVQQSQVHDVSRPRQFSVTDHGDFATLPNMYGTTYRTYELSTEKIKNEGLTTYF